jgi:hypothetical protein
MTRRLINFEKHHQNNLVDAGISDAIRSSHGSAGKGQGDSEKRVKINEDIWQEWVLIAQYLYRMDEEAEIADMFEFFRTYVYGGEPYSKSTLARADREVATDIANGL